MPASETPRLPPLLQTFVDAHNSFDGRTLAACFCADGRVLDEGREYLGIPAIEAWFAEVSARYRARLQVKAYKSKGGKIVLAGEVSGSFDGSPVWLRYRLSLKDDKIARLRIAP